MKKQLSILMILALPLLSVGGEPDCDKIIENVETPKENASAAPKAPLSTAETELLVHETAINQLINAYVDELGYNQDPFSLVVTQDQTNQIYTRLLTVKKNNQWTLSSLAKIDTQLKKVYAFGDKVYNSELIKQIIQETVEMAANKNTSTQDLQSNLFALRYSMTYLRRFKTQQAVDRDGEKTETPSKDEKKEEKQPQQQQKPQQGGKPPKPNYPKLPEEYKPFTKDTNKSGGGSAQDQVKVAEVNFYTAYFGQRYFVDINRNSTNPFKEATFPTPLKAPGKYQLTNKKLIIDTLGESEVDLFIPPLHSPLQPSNPNVTIARKQSGGYKMTITGNVGKVEIPLRDEDNIAMNPLFLDMLKRPVGFKSEEWPQKIQTEILHKYTQKEAETDPLRVAKALADHLAKDYLYSVGERSEVDPINALNAGAFQCDMAAYSMVSILRDHYNVPSRVVGGFRAKSQKGVTGASYLVLPGEAHVWVEVYHNKKWNLYDPTPVNKDSKKKNDEKGEEDPFRDNQLEDQPKPKPEEQDGKQKADKGEQSEGKEGKEGEEGEEGKEAQEGEEGKESGKQKGDKDNKNKEGKEGKESDKQKSDKDGKDNKNDKNDKEQGPKLSQEEKDELNDKLLKELELGSLQLEPTPEKNPLLERTMRILFQNVLNPTRKGLDIQNGLSLMTSAMKKFNTPQLRSYFENAITVHASAHPDLKNWIDREMSLMSTQEVNKTFQNILNISRSVDLYIQIMDPTGPVPVPHRLSATLHAALEDLRNLSHPKAQDIALVNDLMKNLPGVARQMVNKQFDLGSVGPNTATYNMAEKLKAGQLNDLRLLSELSPIADFILNSTPRPEYMQVKTWVADGNKRRGRDILPLQRYSDISRAILGQPGKSIEENMQDGTAYVLTHKKRVQIPAGRGADEAERITIVLYDTSGSMMGDSAEFQAGLIGAFTAKALSDVSGTGKHRHKVLIVPFDTEPGTPVRVTNSVEAQAILRDYKKSLKNTGGGTDIQKAMIQAMALIADAEKRNGEPLAAANIVLMTDGQADIHAEELMKARLGINRTTPLQTMFIAIRESNEELMKFAMDSKKMGAEQGFYREYGQEAMSNYLQKARTLNFKSGDETFFSTESSKQISPKTIQLMEQASRQASDFYDALETKQRHGVTPKEHLDRFEKVPWRDGHNDSRPLENWIVKLRSFALGQIFQDKKLLSKVTDDLMTNFETITGVKFNDLSGFEQEQLRHFLKYAAGLESGI